MRVPTRVFYCPKSLLVLWTLLYMNRGGRVEYSAYYFFFVTVHGLGAAGDER